MVREVFSGGWNPDIDPVVRTGERTSRLTEFLKKFDFAVLRSLLEQYAQRSQQQGDRNFLDAESVFDSYSGDAVFSSAENIIGLNAYVDEDPDANYCKVAESLVHEELHAITDRSHHYDYITGYHRKQAFRLFNEGLTEKLAQEVTAAYLSATAAVSKEKWPEFDKYPVARKFVDYILDRLADALSISRETLWQALIRGMFQNESLHDKELQDLFEETFSPAFFRVLEKAESEEELEKAMQQSGGIQAFAGRIRKWLRL